MTAYYNEIDPKAAAWLRELIKNGLIAHGEVDERSIEDVTPNDVRGFTQCHFFAGIGVWSHSLRKAGWSDDRPCWTGSCPCQPFSSAGKGKGFTDERHLWPAFFHLIQNVRPDVVFGEQVASKDGLAWLDLVQADLEGAGYACGATDTCAAGFGAPHIRQRLYWVAHATGQRQPIGELGEQAKAQRTPLVRGSQLHERSRRYDNGYGGEDGGVGISDSAGPQQGRQGSATDGHGCSADTAGCFSGMDDTKSLRRRLFNSEDIWEADAQGDVLADTGYCPTNRQQRPTQEHPSPTNGFWRDADWLFCRDGKWRSVEPSTFPLAHGATSRVGRLRGYGNAVTVGQAVGFITAYLEVEHEKVQHVRR